LEKKQKEEQLKQDNIEEATKKQAKEKEKSKRKKNKETKDTQDTKHTITTNEFTDTEGNQDSNVGSVWSWFVTWLTFFTSNNTFHTNNTANTNNTSNSSHTINNTAMFSFHTLYNHMLNYSFAKISNVSLPSLLPSLPSLPSLPPFPNTTISVYLPRLHNTSAAVYGAFVEQFITVTKAAGVDNATLQILHTSLSNVNTGWLMVVLVVASGVILVEIWAMFYRRTEVSTSKKTTEDKEQDIFKNGVQLSNTCTTNPTKQQGKNNSATADEPAKKGKEKEEEEDDKDEDETQAAEKDMDDDLLGVDAINPPSELVEAFGMIIKHMKTPQQRKAARRFVCDRMFQDEEGGEFQEDGIRILSLFEKDNTQQEQQEQQEQQAEKGNEGTGTEGREEGDAVGAIETAAAGRERSSSEERLNELLNFHFQPSTGHELDKYKDDDLNHWVMVRRC
jgi:hypothetical protein